MCETCSKSEIITPTQLCEICSELTLKATKQCVEFVQR